MNQRDQQMLTHLLQRAYNDGQLTFTWGWDPGDDPEWLRAKDLRVWRFPPNGDWPDGHVHIQLSVEE